MHKKDLAEKVAERTNLPYNTVLRVLDMTEDVITGEVRSGNKVTLTGFLTFKPVDLPARERRNPSTGEPVVLLPGRTVRIKIGDTFKREVAGA